MAVNTDPRLQNQIIYSIYVRNHTPEGTFRAVIGDLDRVRALGTDIIWLMPIHPIGVQGKKGTLGCPYANRDYRSVNPEYGTMEDFQELVRQIHARGMKCMIDVVYNHTSPDSVLYAEHPEYFYHNKEGKPGNKVGDWADVIDLDYTTRAVSDRYPRHVGEAGGRLPLRRGLLRAAGVLAAGAPGGRQGQPGLHLAGGDGAPELRLHGAPDGHLFRAGL